jgi:hypothetical protein
MESAVVQIVVAVIGTGILSELLNFLRNRKNAKRISNAEAGLKQIEELRAVIEILQGQIDRMKKEAEVFNTRLAEKDRLFLVLSREKDATELRMMDYKQCLNQCITCSSNVNGSCPALQKKLELDSVRAEGIEKKPKY